MPAAPGPQPAAHAQSAPTSAGISQQAETRAAVESSAVLHSSVQLFNMPAAPGPPPAAHAQSAQAALSGIPGMLTPMLLTQHSLRPHSAARLI
jgi:hypothetical protein